MPPQTPPAPPGTPEKVAAISALQATRNSGEDAEMTLRIAGNAQDADQIWEANGRLRVEIDILIGRLMDAWIAQTNAQTAALATIRSQIDANVAQIKAQQNVAAQVVQILGYLDNVLTIAKNFLV